MRLGREECSPRPRPPPNSHVLRVEEVVVTSHVSPGTVGSAQVQYCRFPEVCLVGGVLSTPGTLLSRAYPKGVQTAHLLMLTPKEWCSAAAPKSTSRVLHTERGGQLGLACE